jgi:hypothetical protein
LKKFFLNLFSIYPGEEKSALLFSVLAFLWALTISSAVKFADAAFIIHVGAQSLPTVYILTGSITIGLALFLLNAFQNIDTYKIFIAVLASSLAFYSFAAFCLWTGFALDSPYIWFGLRIVGYLSLTVILTCYWTFVDQYHHIQDAKRRYSLFTSSIFLGIATTGIIMRIGALTFPIMIAFILAGLMLTIFWILHIHKNIPAVHNEHEHEPYSSQDDLSLFALFRSIWSSPFTMFIMAGSFLTYLLLSNTEFNYMSSYQNHFAPFTEGDMNPELTQFFGKVVAGISIVSIFIGMIFYPQTIRRFGVTSLLLFTPLLLLVTFFGWNVSDWLIFPIIGNFLDEGAVYVIEDSNLNLLLNGVPSKMKYKIRLFIESFFEPFGALMSGILLSMPFIHSKSFGLIMSVVACLVAIALRRRYLKAIYSNLEENAIHFDRPLKNWFSTKKEKSKHRLLAILRLGHEDASNFAIEGLMQLHDKEMLHQLLKLLDLAEEHAKRHFIEHLPSSPYTADPMVLHHLHKWAKESQTLLSSVHLYLAKHGLLPQEAALSFISDPDLNLRGSALIALKKSDFSLVDQETKKMIASKKKEQICMALTVMGFETSAKEVSLLRDYLKHPFITIARSAASSLLNAAHQGLRLDPKAILVQLAATTDHQMRILCLKILEKISDLATIEPIVHTSISFRPNERRCTEQLLCNMGDGAIDALLSVTKDSNQDHKARVIAGRALGRLSPTLLRAHLAEIISSEMERAFFYFAHFHKIPTHYGIHNLQMLKESLLSSYHAVLDFIIQLLGVAGELEDCELLARVIRSEHPKLRAQVIETLEKSCELAIFRMIEPLINELPTEEKLHQYHKLGYPTYTLVELLNKLSHSPLQLDQVIAAAYMHELKVPEWEETLKRQMGSRETLFNHFAIELLEA